MENNAQNPGIVLDDVKFRYPSRQQDTLSIESLLINRGEQVFIQGSSGSGKTTLLNLICGINTPTQGTTRVLDKSIGELSGTQRDRLRADHLGVIFQQFNLLPYLSILENVELPCHFSGIRAKRAGNSRHAAQQLLENLHIPSALFEQSVSELSVGQQQRVAVARALIGSPEIVIADEPTSALDTDNRQRFLDLLFSHIREQGSTLIFVSHDNSIANNFERIITLSDINIANTDTNSRSTVTAL